MNWYGISALRMLGLAWDVKAPRLEDLDKKAISPAPVLVERFAPVASGDD